MTKKLRKRKVKLYMKLAMPLEKNFDLHEEVQTNQKYLNALKFRLRKLPENVYTISFSEMYKNKDPWEMEKESEFVDLLKKFFKDLPDEEFMSNLVPRSSSIGSLKDFIIFADNNNFDFNGQKLSDFISSPESSTLIIRNSPSESNPYSSDKNPFSDDPGTFFVNSFYFVHDIFCHAMSELDSNLVKEVADSIYRYTEKCMKLYKNKVGETMFNHFFDGWFSNKYDENQSFSENLAKRFDLGNFNFDTKKFKSDLYSERGFKILSEPFLEHIIKYKRHSSADDQFCDFFAAVLYSDIMSMTRPSVYKLERGWGEKRYYEEYYPDEEISLARKEFKQEVDSVINSDLFKNMYKGKVIYHPFYVG